MRLRPDQLVVFVLDLTNLARLCACLPAVGGDQITIVLHRLGPVVHQVLVNVVGVEQRRALEGGEQILGDCVDEHLRVSAFVEAFQSRRVDLAPLGEELRHVGVEGGKLGMAEDGRFELRVSGRELKVAGAQRLERARRAHWG